MTSARRLLAGQLHFVSRRCTQRLLLLTPTQPVNQVVRYALAAVAPRYQVRICAVLASSNHVHLVLEDFNSELAQFMQDFDQLIARALNSHYKRGENFWSQPDSYSNQELKTPEEALAKLVYLFVNPTADGLVEHPDLWPGLLTRPEDMGVLHSVEPRPERAFFGGKRPADYEPTYEPGRQSWSKRKRRPPEPNRAAHRERPSTLPEVAAFDVHVPTLLADMPQQALHRLLRERVEARVAQIRDERAAEGKPFMGRDRVIRRDPKQPAGEAWPDFAMDPRLPGREDAPPERKAELTGWRAAYREAYDLWRTGNRRVVFPVGTYAMRVFHAALVAPT